MTARHALPISLLALLLVVSPAVAKRGRPLRAYSPGPAPNAVLLPGDDFSTAIEIATLPFSTTVDICALSNDIDLSPFCTNAQGADVVYTFTPTTDLRIYASTCGATNYPALVLFEEGVPGPLDCGEGDCGLDFTSFGEIRYAMQAGHRYYFVLKGYDPVCSDPLPLSIVAYTPQPGEDAASAIEIASLPFSTSGNTTLAWPDAVGQCVSRDSPDVFYRFTPLTPTCADLSLCGLEGYDTALMLFEEGSGTPFACSDDDCASGGLSSRLPNQLLQVGTTYLVVVSGYQRSAGPYSLEITHCGPTATRVSSWGQLKQIYR